MVKLPIGSAAIASALLIVGQAISQHPEDQATSTPLPSWVTDSVSVPLESDRAAKKLFYLMTEDFKRQPDNVARATAVALNNAGLGPLSRDELDKTYALMLEWRIERWKTSEVRGKIRIELAKREARDKALAKRLAGIAEELAALKSDAKGSEIGKRVATALEATGYVVKDGQVLTHEEAFPPFGLVR